MIEKATVEMTEDGNFRSVGHRCDEMNPKELLLYAAARCAGLTALMVMQKMHLTPKRLEVAYSGELDTETVQAESVFLSFHTAYNVDCGSSGDQEKANRALTMTHEKYCGMTQMLRRIAPVSHEIVVVSSEPQPTH
ncbi:MAG: OsmC family protein [Alistipes sp.]|nr:OsmC family protein [Alistipes sp.]